MSDKLHTLFNVADGIHIAQAWSVADYAARDDLTVVATDVGRIAQVLEDDSFWILVDDDDGEGGQTWQRVGMTTDDLAIESVGTANDGGTSEAYARADHVHDASFKADRGWTVRTVTGTTDTTTSTDLGNPVLCTNAGAVAISVPSGLPLGVYPYVFMGGAATQGTFAGTGGLTVTAPPTLTLKSRTGASGAMVALNVLSSTVAVLSGDVAVT